MFVKVCLRHLTTSLPSREGTRGSAGEDWSSRDRPDRSRTRGPRGTIPGKESFPSWIGTDRRKDPGMGRSRGGGPPEDRGRKESVRSRGPYPSVTLRPNTGSPDRSGSGVSVLPILPETTHTPHRPQRRFGPWYKRRCI